MAGRFQEAGIILAINTEDIFIITNAAASVQTFKK
jgi:hypothetical protein